MHTAGVVCTVGGLVLYALWAAVQHRLWRPSVVDELLDRAEVEFVAARAVARLLRVAWRTRRTLGVAPAVAQRWRNIR